MVSASELGKQLRGGKIWPRRLRRLLGRILHRNQIWYGHQALRLDRRVQAAWPVDIPWEWEWQRQAVVIQAALDQARRDEHQVRVDAWKHRMARGGPRAHSWITAEMAPQSLRVEGPPSTSPADAFGMINRHWSQVSGLVTKILLTNGFRQGLTFVTGLLTGSLLRPRWDVAELKAVPLQAWADLATLANFWFKGVSSHKFGSTCLWSSYQNLASSPEPMGPWLWTICGRSLWSVPSGDCLLPLYVNGTTRADGSSNGPSPAFMVQCSSETPSLGLLRWISRSMFIAMPLQPWTLARHSISFRLRQ